MRRFGARFRFVCNSCRSCKTSPNFALYAPVLVCEQARALTPLSVFRFIKSQAILLGFYNYSYFYYNYAFIFFSVFKTLDPVFVFTNIAFFNKFIIIQNFSTTKHQFLINFQKFLLGGKSNFLEKPHQCLMAKGLIRVFSSNFIRFSLSGIFSEKSAQSKQKTQRTSTYKNKKAKPSYLVSKNAKIKQKLRQKAMILLYRKPKWHILMSLGQLQAKSACKAQNRQI